MKMVDNPYRQSCYLLSAHLSSQFPADNGIEVAFVGRSNVGKSSVINSLTDQKRLAKTSKTPGRTRQINFFTVTDDIRLVDLPGYGFAAVDLAMRRQWDKVINSYFTTRQSLAGLVLIIDIRRGLKEDDLKLLDWCDSVGIPVHIVVNKADKLSRQKQIEALRTLEQDLGEYTATFQPYSVLNRTGQADLLTVLNEWLFPG